MKNLVGKRVKERRLALHLSQKKLGELIGLSQQAIADLEKGRTNSYGKLPIISETLKVNLDWLATGQGVMEPEQHPIEESYKEAPEDIKRAIELLLKATKNNESAAHKVAGMTIFMMEQEFGSTDNLISKG